MVIDEGLQNFVKKDEINIFSPKNNWKVLIGYIVLLFAFWVIRISLLPVIDEQAPNDFVQFYISNYLRLLFWVIPLTLILLSRVAEWPRLFGIIPLRGIDILSVSLLVIELVIAILLDVRFQPAAITDQVWAKVGSYIIVAPLVEEIVFRGYLFPEISRYTGTIWGALLSSALFTLIHFPYWIYREFSAEIFLYQSLFIFGFGLLMCLLVKVTKSLMPAFAIHGLNNLFAQFIR